MTVNDLVTGANLNTDDFDQGGTVAGSVTINVDGQTVNRGAGGLSSPDQVMSYSNATQELTLTRNDGSANDVLDLSALAADIFVDGAAFDATTSVITLTDNDAGTPDITIDLAALLGVSADGGNILTNGTDGKPMLDQATLCTAIADNCLDDCDLVDIFGNVLGTVQMAQP